MMRDAWFHGRLLVVLLLSAAAHGATPTAAELAELLLARAEQLTAICYNYGSIERPHGLGQVDTAPIMLRATTGFYGYDSAAGVERYTFCASAPKQMVTSTFDYEAGYQDAQRREMATATIHGTRPTFVNTVKPSTGPGGLPGCQLTGWWILNSSIPRRLKDGTWRVLRSETQPEPAVVVGTATMEVWLAPHLGYALTRMRSTGPYKPGTWMMVYDTTYGKHENVRGVQIPTAYILATGAVAPTPDEQPSFRGLATTYARCGKLRSDANAVAALQVSHHVPLIFGGVLRDPGAREQDGKLLGYSLDWLLTEGLRAQPFGLQEPTLAEMAAYGQAVRWPQKG